MNSARYEAVWVNGVWVVRDRHVWNHQPAVPPLQKIAQQQAKEREQSNKSRTH